MNVSFGIEFDDDVICAVDKLERDYVLKEANSCHSGAETSPGSNQDGQCHRKEKYSGRKVGGKPPGSSRRKMCTSNTDSGCMKLETADEAMSLTVVKGHDGNKVLSSMHDEPGDQDVLCTWNSPLLVSTPAVVSLRRRCVTNENIRESNNADAAAATGGGAVAVTPRQLNSARKPKTKNSQKTKLFGALLNASSSATSPTESLQERRQSPVCSGRHSGISDGNGKLSPISDPDSKLQLISF